MEAEHPPARLLIVDDIELNRELLVRRARRLGHDSATAADGEAALAQLAAGPWDLVLLDITMPRMDGYETLARIKADPATAHIPVIMVSAIDEIDSVVRCLELGADDYVTKPFNPVLLQARIEASLAKKRLADQKQATLRALARELELARRIQRGFLPTRLPELPGWQLAAHFEPARQVGGDFYDVLPLADGRVGLVIADICDKGVGAALYMALFRTLVRALLTRAEAGMPAQRLLVEVLAFVNDYIAREHGRENMFATLVAAILEPASGRMAYANLGHDAPVLHHPASGAVRRLEPGAPACGLMPGLVPEVRQVEMAPGECLLLFTDGVSDCVGLSGRFGEEALLAVVAQRARDGAEAVAAAVQQALAAHAGGCAAHDDVTLLCLCRSPA